MNSGKFNDNIISQRHYFCECLNKLNCLNKIFQYTQQRENSKEIQNVVKRYCYAVEMVVVTIECVIYYCLYNIASLLNDTISHFPFALNEQSESVSTDSGPTKSYILSTDSEEDMNEWVTAISEEMVGGASYGKTPGPQHAPKIDQKALDEVGLVAFTRFCVVALLMGCVYKCVHSKSLMVDDSVYVTT